MVRSASTPPPTRSRLLQADGLLLKPLRTDQRRCWFLVRLILQLAVSAVAILYMSAVQAMPILCAPSEVQVVLGTPEMGSALFELSGCRGTSPQSLNISLGGGSASLSVVLTDSWLGTVRIFSPGVPQFTLTVRNSVWAPLSPGPALLYDTTNAYNNTVLISNTSIVAAQAAAIAAPNTTLLFTTITLSGCSLRSTGWASLVDIRSLSAESLLAMHDVTILSDLGTSTGSAARVISVSGINSSTLTFVNCNTTITASSVQTSVYVISLGSSGSGGGLQVTSGTWVLNVNRVVAPGTVSMLTAVGLMAVSVNISRVNFVLNHTVLGNFTRAWTSATMLDLRCTDCPTVNIANNTVHMGAAIAPPETSCTYYSLNYAVAVVFSSALTNSVALVSDNNVTVILTSPSTQVCNRNTQFVLFAPAVRTGTSLTITRNNVDAYHNATTTSYDNNAPTLMVVFANPSSMGSSLGHTAIDGNRVNVFLQWHKNVDVTFFASQPSFDASIVVALNRITGNEDPATSVLDQSNDQRVAVCATQYGGQFTHRVCGNVISIWSFSATVSLFGSSSATSASYMNAGMVIERNVVLLLSSLLRLPSGGVGGSSGEAIARVVDRATFYGGIVQHNNVTISGFDYVQSSFVCNAQWYQNYSASPSGSGGSRWQAPTRVWNNTMDIVYVRSYVYAYVLQSLTVYNGAFGEAHENQIRVARAAREGDDNYHVYVDIVSSVSLVPTTNNIGATAIQLFVTNNVVEYSEDAATAHANTNIASSISGSSSASAASIVTIAYNAVVVRGRSETTSGPSTYHVGQRRVVDCTAVADADAAMGNKGAAIVGARMLMCNNTMVSVGRDTAIGLTSTMCNWCSTGTFNGSILTVRDNVVDAVSAYRVDVSWCSGCISSGGVANVTGNLAYLTEVDSITAVAGAYTGTMASPTTAGGVRTYLVAQNSVEGFASSQRAMPAVGDRLPSTSGYDNNCHQLPTVNPLVRAWYAAANATLVAVSVVCDNHIYAMDTRSSLSVNLISYASFQLQTSGASEGPALYVIDNLIRVTGGAPAVTVRWANSVNFNSYGTISQQALWSFVLASNTALVSNVPSVSGDLFHVSLYKSAERPPATYFIGGNMMVVVGTAAYPLAELRSMPSYAASLDCPTITEAVRSVQCNNTIVAWNISDAGSSTMLIRAELSGSSTAVYQNFDTIVVANNSVGMYHLQRANVIVVGMMQSYVSSGHIDVTDNVARVDNISSSVSAVLVRYLYPYASEATFVALNRIAMHTETPSSSGQPQYIGSSCAALSGSAPKRSLMRVVRNVVEGSNIPTSAAITATACQSMYTNGYSSVAVAWATYVCANAILIMGGPRYAAVAITVVSYASVSQSNSTLFVTDNDVLVNASNSSGSMITPSSSSMRIALVNYMSFDSSYSSSASLTGPITAAITDNRVSICGILPATLLTSLVGDVRGSFYYATSAGKSLTMLVALNNIVITDDVAASLVAASTVHVSATAVSTLTVSQAASMVGVYAQVSVYANNVTIKSARISTAMMTFVGTATLSSVSSRLAVEGNALYVSCASSVASVRIVGVASFTARTSSLSLLANTVVVDTSASPLLAAAATTPRAGDAVVVSIAFCGTAFPMTPQQGGSSSDVLSITILQNVVRVVNAAPRVAVALANAPVGMATTVDMCVACRVSLSTTASAGSGQSAAIVVAQNEFYFRTTVAAVANTTTSPTTTTTTATYVGSPLFSVSLCRQCELLAPSSSWVPATVSLSFNRIHVRGGAGLVVVPTSDPDPTSPPDDEGGGGGIANLMMSTPSSSTAIAFAGARVRIVLCDTCTIAYNHSLACASNEIMAANCSAVVASLVDVVSVTPSASTLPTHNASAMGFGINLTANVLVVLDTNSTTVVLLRLPWRVPTTIGFRVLVAANSIQATATSAVLGVLQQKLQQQQRPVWALNVTLAHVLGVLVPESKLEASMNRVVATAAQPAAPASVLGALLRIDSEASQANGVVCCVMDNHDDGIRSDDTAQVARAAGMCTSSSSTFTARVFNTTLSSTGGADGNSSAGSGSGGGGGGLALLDITTLASMPVIPPHTYGLTIIAAFNNLSQWPGATTPHPQLVKLVVGSDTHRCLLSVTANRAPVFGINASAVHGGSSGSSSPRKRTEVVVDNSSVLGTIFLGGWRRSPSPLLAVGHSLTLNVSASSIRGIELFGTLDDLRVDVHNNSHLANAAGNNGGAVCNASQRSCGGAAAALTIAAGGMVSNISVTIRNATFGGGAACGAVSGGCGGGILAVKDDATLRHATVHVAACGGDLWSSGNANSGGGGGVLLDVAATNIVENVSMVVERTSLIVEAEGGGSSGGPPLAALAHRRQLLNVVLNISGSTITAVGVGAIAGGGGNPAQPSSSIVAFGPLSIDAETNNVRVTLDNTTLVGYTYVAQWLSTATVRNMTTLGNTVVASACIRWAAGDGMRGVAPRSATPGAWRAMYQPQCTSTYLDGATCPCSNQPTPSVSASASLTATHATGTRNDTRTASRTKSKTVVYGALPPCPTLTTTPASLNAAAIQQGIGKLIFTLPPPTSNGNFFSLPSGAVLSTTYVKWTVLPSNGASGGGPGGGVAQPGGFGGVDGASIVCTVATEWTINCSLPASAGVDPLIPETVGVRLRSNVYAFRCDDSSLTAAVFVLDPAAPSVMQEAVQVVSGIAAAAGFGSGFAGAPDGQVLAALTGMSCASTVSQEASGPLQYLVSPFYDLGAVAVVLGNTGLAAAVFGVRLLLVRLLSGRHRLCKPFVMRFPSIDFTLACFLSQGVVGFGGKLLFSFPSAGEGILGLLAVGSIAAFYGFGLRRSLELRSGVTIRPYTLTSVGQRWFLPSGYWRPRRLVRTCGSFFSKTNAAPAAPFAHFAAAAGCLTTLLASIVPPKSGCVAQLVSIALLLAGSGAVLALYQPLRIPATHVFAVASYANMSLLMVLYAVGIDHPSVTLEMVKGYMTLFQTFLVVARSAHDIAAKIIEIFVLRSQIVKDDDDDDDDGGTGGGLIDLAVGMLEGGDAGHLGHNNNDRGGDGGKELHVEMLPITPDDIITLSDDDDDVDLDGGTKAKGTVGSAYASVGGGVDDASLADTAAASLRKRALEMDAQMAGQDNDDAAGAYGLLGMSFGSARASMHRSTTKYGDDDDHQPTDDDDGQCNSALRFIDTPPPPPERILEETTKPLAAQLSPGTPPSNPPPQQPSPQKNKEDDPFDGAPAARRLQGPPSTPFREVDDGCLLPQPNDDCDEIECTL